MKIIISHDVDHLYPTEHIFRDLIFPKLWIRSLLQLIKGDISFYSFYWRLLSVFDKRLHRIPEIIDFDKKMGINSTFFFGMDNILGMSYQKKKAKVWIQYVLEYDFDVGVHGVEIDDLTKMQEEYTAFQRLSGLDNFGIRTHYVRYNETTFKKMNEIGYLFDTSEFNKQEIEVLSPYKIGSMWEFPLHIMDGYVINNDLEAAKRNTILALQTARNNNIEYITFLFHDPMFNEKTHPLDKAYYEWFIQYCINAHYEFISYREAIQNLNK
ncbi:MAG: hypothetical protein RR313_01225 [Anaerovoracaceae bacterium]